MSDAAELDALRTRLVARDLGTRRRIERALHDGAQQDLIAVSVRLQLLRELLADDSPAARELVDELRRDVRGALDRLRALASEVYPAILEARGLASALRDAARAAPASARVDAEGLGRYPSELEATVYFACRAALDGVRPDAEVTVTLREEDGELRLGIEGAGVVDRSAVEDLVAAAGGALAVEPTSLRAAIPLP